MPDSTCVMHACNCAQKSASCVLPLVWGERCDIRYAIIVEVHNDKGIVIQNATLAASVGSLTGTVAGLCDTFGMVTPGFVVCCSANRFAI